MSLWSPEPGMAERLQHLHAMRLSYEAAPLDLGDLPDAPGTAFAAWFEDAAAVGVIEPNAMVLATAGEDGAPAARTVLLKGVTAQGFQFFTNYHSRKGRHLAAHPKASLLFAWLPIYRQVAVTGDVVRLEEPESDAYFASRPRGSQIAAWASAQSAVVESRDALRREWQRYEDRFRDAPVPRPPHWGGYEVRPEQLEFWQGQPSRMHDRIVYRAATQGTPRLDDAGAWSRVRLAP